MSGKDSLLLVFMGKEFTESKQNKYIILFALLSFVTTESQEVTILQPQCQK